MDWEAGFLLYIQEHLRSDVLNPFMKAVTHTGDKGIFFIALCAILLLIPKLRRIGFIAAMSIAVESILNNLLIKNIVARTRPYDAIEGLNNLVGRQSDYSFPSGHTGAAFAVAGALLVVALLGMPVAVKAGKISREKTSVAYKVFAILMIIYSFVLAFSRMYVGVHYPTDVLGGLLLGLATSAIAYLIYQLIIKKIAEKKTAAEESSTAV